MTGFVTSVVAYAVLLVAEAVRPGFVSRFLSVHLFLLAALAFAAWELAVTKRYGEWAVLHYFAAILAAPACAYLVWSLGAGFGEFRLVAALFAAFVPITILSLTRTSSKV